MINSNAPASRNGPPGAPSEELSRSSRLMGFAKATRDTYIPKLASSVSLFVGQYDERGLWSASANATNGTARRLPMPEDATVALYPTYSKFTRKEDGKLIYHVDTNGWVSCPGLMTRKNRLIISLARQLTKLLAAVAANTAYNSPGTSSVSAQTAMAELLQQRQDIYTDSDTESIVSSNSTPPSTGSVVADVLKERLSTFIARSIPDAPLEITIGSDDVLDESQLVTQRVATDANGNFNVCIDCPYKPSYLRVASTEEDSVFAFQDILVVEDTGFGIISDIDDTVKLTGVCGDKRELMKSLLLNPVSNWAIQPVIAWFGSLYNDADLQHISFHYVSNSPWQLFPTIREYFKYANLPPGSIHLKQYTGNIIASLMEQKQYKKKSALYKILEDFPRKRFICVGDSGEYDLEAYTDVAKNYPSRVLSIYIRHVSDSLSDIDDLMIYRHLLKVTARYYKEELQNSQLTQKAAEPHQTHQNPAQSAEVKDLIDLDSKPGPMVPKKPTNLKGNQIRRKPPPPDREIELSIAKAETTGKIPEVVPPLPPRRAATVLPPTSTATALPLTFETMPLEEREEYIARLVVKEMQDIYPHIETVYELEETDKKGVVFFTRVITALELLKGKNTQLRYFNDEDVDLLENTVSFLKR